MYELCKKVYANSLLIGTAPAAFYWHFYWIKASEFRG